MLIAVDTGGTKTLVGRFSTDGTLVSTTKFSTPTSIPKYITELRKAVRELIGDTQPSMLSIGLPGRIDRSGKLLHARNLGWRNVDMTDLLARYYDCPILVENDANLAGLAETRSLKSVPRVSLYVTISTGIGTGIIVDGSIDPDFTSAEGGQMVLEKDGRFATWESFGSGHAIKERYGKLAKDISSKRAWYDIAKDISRGLITLAPVLRPDVIIIGGSIGTYFDKYADTVEGILKEQLHRGNHPRLRQAKHPEEAVIYGCYYHAYDTARRPA